MKSEVIRNIVTIGASAGGITAVSRQVSTFNDDLDAAVFIVIHLSRNSMADVVLSTIQKNTKMRCVIPEDHQQIENRTIYLAPADYHMLVEKGTIGIKHGAYENHWRPAIDVLFRSAAANYDSCVTGIILTGLLDDGTLGMYAIKRSGGLCIVQDPREAEFPDMPNNVLQNMEVDYEVPIGDMGYILSDLFSREACDASDVPPDVKLEAEIARRMSSNVEDLKELGEITPLTCPDCGGVLVKVAHDAVPRYRCYTGHAFTEKTLENEQLKGLEDSLWVAIRMLEERKNLLNTMTGYDTGSGSSTVGKLKKKRVKDIQLHIDRLKVMLINIGEPGTEPN